MPPKVHLFAYFTGNGEAGMRLAASTDGLLWSDVSDRFFISPDKGLMRDPFLLKGPDGTFRLIWTDAWHSKTIGYSSSTDLLHWKAPQHIPVMDGIDGTQNCWAPEMVFDDATQQYVLYWASTVEGKFEETAGKSEDKWNHRMWYVTTKDFDSFSEPQVFYDGGFNVIDVTLLKSNEGGYRMIAKDETLVPIRKQLFHCFADSVFGPWTAPSEPFSPAWVEGPATLSSGEWTYVYFDEYTSKRYGAMRTKDFIEFEDCSDSVSFPQGARHGSIVSVDKSLVDALCS